mmetsp:Transcript_71048/g.118793  ORF Transcript_71048/g.118793 Transcript_71048/m.118793 type:complete len:225 (+) Transcript_71048:1469-2143(+)
MDVGANCTPPDVLDLGGIGGQPRAEGPGLVARHVEESDVLEHQAAEQQLTQALRQPLPSSRQAGDLQHQGDEIEDAQPQKHEAVFPNGAGVLESLHHVRKNYCVDGVGRACNHSADTTKQQPTPLGGVQLRNTANRPLHLRLLLFLRHIIVLFIDLDIGRCAGGGLALEPGGGKSFLFSGPRIHRLQPHGSWNLFVGLLLSLAHGSVCPVLLDQLCVCAFLQQP